MEIVPFLRRKLANIDTVTNLGKTVALPPEGHAPTLKEIILLEEIGVRVADRGGVGVVEVPIGTGAYVTGKTMEIVKTVGTDQLARMLPRMPDKQPDNLASTGSMVQRMACTEPAVRPKSCPCLHAEKKGQQRDVDVGKNCLIFPRDEQ